MGRSRNIMNIARDILTKEFEKDITMDYGQFFFTIKHEGREYDFQLTNNWMGADVTVFDLTDKPKKYAEIFMQKVSTGRHWEMVIKEAVRTIKERSNEVILSQTL